MARPRTALSEKPVSHSASLHLGAIVHKAGTVAPRISPLHVDQQPWEPLNPGQWVYEAIRKRLALANSCGFLAGGGGLSRAPGAEGGRRWGFLLVARGWSGLLRGAGEVGLAKVSDFGSRH